MGLMTSQLRTFRARSILWVFMAPKLIILFIREGSSGSLLIETLLPKLYFIFTTILERHTGSIALPVPWDRWGTSHRRRTLRWPSLCTRAWSSDTASGERKRGCRGWTRWRGDTPRSKFRLEQTFEVVESSGQTHRLSSQRPEFDSASWEIGN